MIQKVPSYQEGVYSNNTFEKNDFYKKISLHSKLLNVLYRAIGVIAYALRYHRSEEVKGFFACTTVLSDSRMLLDGMRTPWKIYSLTGAAHQLYDEIRSTQIHSVSNKKLLEIIVHISSLIKKILSLITKIFLRPVLFFGGHFCWRKRDHFEKASQIISLIKTIFQAITLLGKIAQKKQMVLKTVSLLLMTSECILRGILYHGVRVHPAIPIVHFGLKSLVEFYKIWHDTAFYASCPHPF